VTEVRERSKATPAAADPWVGGDLGFPAAGGARRRGGGFGGFYFPPSHSRRTVPHGKNAEEEKENPGGPGWSASPSPT
jgi:hypothetical protein